MRTLSAALLLLFTAAPFACGPSDPSDAEPVADVEQPLLNSQGITMQGITMQGTHLLGTSGNGPTLKGFRLSTLILADGRPASGALEGGELVATVSGQMLRGPALAGATLEAELSDGRRRRVRVASVKAELGKHAGPDEPGQLTLRYELQEPRDGGYVALCGADADGQKTALAVSGWWDAKGARFDDSDLFTFSCANGVIAKCYRWGYRPWARGGALKDVHQACTRMARADYCGDGRSFTQENTQINVSDELGPSIQTAAKDAGMVFEAGWTTRGAVCFSHRRWVEVRDHLNDNRCTAELETASTCDSAQAAYSRDAGVLLVNESRPQLIDGGH